MNIAKTSNFQILDCTIRDGGYLNSWKFEKKLVRELYRALSKSGVDYIEIGYRGSTKHFNSDDYGIWRFSPEETIREVVSNIDGAKLALMVDYGKIEPEDFCDAGDSMVELVRLAANKDCFKEAIALLEQIKVKGYKVSLNLMNYNNFLENERNELITMLKGTGIDYIYVVDSYGSLFPHQIGSIVEPLLSIPKIKVGFHPHNSLQMAFANSLEAVRCGVHILDSTVYGMGRAAGNLPTEIMIAFLEKEKKDRYNSIPLLNIIDRYFVNLFNENKWGYQLPYMLSGMFQCHPNYAKTLVETHEYTIEDIWKAMEYIHLKKPVGFSKKILDDLMSEGIMRGPDNQNTRSAPKKTGSNSRTDRYTQVEISYINRHKDRDFLILANGPSLNEYKDKINTFIEKYDPVVLGANYMGGLFKLHYHAFTNKRRFDSYIDTVDPDSKLLIGRSISEELIREYTDRVYERLSYIDALDPHFDIQDGLITTNCRTVAILLLALAIVMGARRIFAVGMDGYIQNQTSENMHFYKEKDEKEDRGMILEMHRWCQYFLEQIDAYLIARGKEGIHILTPTNYRAFYKGLENYIGKTKDK
ncbi:MAG: aldolase catalytic domain-containing protein [Candidatus Omnitrophica bacterium]|nr:aldolase catalytic domain-containing protein [Candidatus Omnitrophota bacterium]